MCCSKVILFVSNALLFAFGIFVIGISSVVISRGNEYGDLLWQGVVTLPIIILLFGIFICILGFLGCFGAIRESKCMLYTYSTIVLLLFFGEIVVAVLIIAHPSFTRNALEASMNNQYANYNVDPATKKSIDQMQDKLKCCGVNGPSYFGLLNIPDSCCGTSALTCTLINAYQLGCVDAIIVEFKSITVMLGVVGIVLSFFMIFSIFTACGLARRSNYK